MGAVDVLARIHSRGGLGKRQRGRQRRLDEDAVHGGVIAQAAEAGVDLDRVTSELEREGVESFMDSYRELIDCIEGKLRQVEPRAA